MTMSPSDVVNLTFGCSFDILFSVAKEVVAVKRNNIESKILRICFLVIVFEEMNFRRF
jgi:hypothetical protein